MTAGHYRAYGGQFWRLDTYITSSNIGFNVFSQGWSMVFPANQLSCLVNFEISCKWIIMVTTYHVGADEFWDIWEALVLEHSLDDFSVLRNAYFI